MPLCLTLKSLSKTIFLYIRSLRKEINFHSSQSECHTFLEAYSFLNFMVRFMQNVERCKTFFASCKILFSDFTPKASKLWNRVVLQGGNTKKLQNHPKKIFQKYPTVLLKCNITFTGLWSFILNN